MSLSRLTQAQILPISHALNVLTPGNISLLFVAVLTNIRNGQVTQIDVLRVGTKLAACALMSP